MAFIFDMLAVRIQNQKEKNIQVTRVPVALGKFLLIMADCQISVSVLMETACGNKVNIDLMRK